MLPLLQRGLVGLGHGFQCVIAMACHGDQVVALFEDLTGHGQTHSA